MIQIRIVEDLWCPHCGAPEIHPTLQQVWNGQQYPIWLIRPFKVDNWSQCLVCAGAYKHGTYERTGKKADPEKGWFAWECTREDEGTLP